MRDGAHVVGNGHLVVVEDDDQPGAQVARVVHRLQGHPCGEGAVAYDRDDVIVVALQVLMVMSHRGTEGERISAQVPMGRATGPLLDVLDIAHFCPAPEEGEETILTAARMAFTTRRPVAVLLDLAFWRG